MILPSLLASLPWNGNRVDPTAAVERAHSDRARSGSKGPGWVPFLPFTVRVLRTRRAPGRSLPILLRPRVARAQIYMLLPTLLVTLFKGWPGLVPNYASRTTTIIIPPSSLVLSQGWGLIDLPLRASNEGSPRPRVARAQKIIRLHPPFVP